MVARIARFRNWQSKYCQTSGSSLSVWSALLALQGFIYDGPAGRIGFHPTLNPDDHANFFTVAVGDGLFSQVVEANKLKASIDLREGSLFLTEVVLAADKGRLPESARVMIGGT